MQVVQPSGNNNNNNDNSESTSVAVADTAEKEEEDKSGLFRVIGVLVGALVTAVSVKRATITNSTFKLSTVAVTPSVETERNAGAEDSGHVLIWLHLAQGIVEHDWVGQHAGLVMSFVFMLGYAGIIFEESVALNKSAIGLVCSSVLSICTC